MNNSYHYMHIWVVEKLYGYNVFAKSQFSLLQKNIFYLTTKFVENIEKVPPTQSQINNHQPNKLINRVMRSNQ